MNFYDILGDKKPLAETDKFFIIKDNYPVSPGHMLIISKEVRLDYFSLLGNEVADLDKAIMVAKGLIEKDYDPAGYNIGMNCREAAGQTIQHMHVHLIPRYYGDVEDPRGGIRNCMPNGNYLKNKQ